ncbi:MAG: hypothetical protein Q9178_007775 [Gyalolechia marmorata]
MSQPTKENMDQSTHGGIDLAESFSKPIKAAARLEKQEEPKQQAMDKRKKQERTGIPEPTAESARILMQQDLQTNLTSFATRYSALMASRNPPSTRKDTAQLRELINRKLKGQHSFTREAGLNPKALDVVIMW